MERQDVSCSSLFYYIFLVIYHGVTLCYSILVVGYVTVISITINFSVKV